MTKMMLLGAAVLLLELPSFEAARAMSIHDFGTMNDDDDATYVTNLVMGSVKMLRAKSEPDQARDLITFFKDSSKTGGLNQLVVKMKEMNGINNRNATNPSNMAHVYEVEDAMAIVLRNHGIDVSARFLRTVCANFSPAGSPRARVMGR